jgi:hypothetical protein
MCIWVDFNYYISIIVTDSFQDYIETEILDGDNKYDAGDYGLQVISIGFISLNVIMINGWKHW